MTPQAPVGLVYARLRVDPSHPIAGTRSTVYAHHCATSDTVTFTRNTP